MMRKGRSSKLGRISKAATNDERFQHFRDLGCDYVPGTGALRPRLVLVSEVPGHGSTEEPFAGPAGAMLGELLDSIDIRRDEVFFTSIVKYRPPNHRTLTIPEVDAGLGYLTRELKVLRPVVVGLLGQTAIHTFFGDVRIGQVHGRYTNVALGGGHYVRMFALYHPTFAVHNEENRDLLFYDFSKMRECLNDYHDMAVL